MAGKSLRKTETERERERETGGVAKGSPIWASPQQGVTPSRSIQQGVGDSWLHLRQTPAALALNCTDLVPGEVCPFMVSRNVAGWGWRSLPLLAKELASEAVNWLTRWQGHHTSRIYWQGGKPALRGGQGAQKIGSSLLFT
jgi:hypothetical protein